MGRGRGHFCADMEKTPTAPEQEPVPPLDDLDRLEQTLRLLKEKQEAWRRLLESMEELSKEKPGPEQPSK